MGHFRVWHVVCSGQSMMKRSPAFLAAPLLALTVAATGACTPASKVAEPDIVMKSPVPPTVLTHCLATKLGQNFRDRRPSVDVYRGIREISIDSPRGERLAFVEVESDHAGGSNVRYWNGDLYWPDHTVSGVWPDIMRDNWHRFEAAQKACQPQATARKPVARAGAPVPPKPAPVKTVAKGPTPKPLMAKPFVPTPAAQKPIVSKAPATKPVAEAAPGAPRQLTP